MRFYAALDVSLAETSICLVDDAGTVIEETKEPSDPAAIEAFFADQQRARRPAVPLGRGQDQEGARGGHRRPARSPLTALSSFLS